MEIGQHHTHAGWHWNRQPDGSVRIVVKLPRGMAMDHILTPEQWASVVSNLSVKGENGESFQQALNFHNGKP